MQEVVNKLSDANQVNSYHAFRNRQRMSCGFQHMEDLGRRIFYGEAQSSSLAATRRRACLNVPCNEKMEWCRAVKKQLRAARDLSTIPYLNCKIVDDSIGRVGDLIDEYFVHPENYNFSCGSDNYHWLEYVPEMNDSSYVVRTNGTIVTVIHWFLGTVFTQDFDLIRTIERFLFNFNMDLHED